MSILDTSAHLEQAASLSQGGSDGSIAIPQDGLALKRPGLCCEDAGVIYRADQRQLVFQSHLHPSTPSSARFTEHYVQGPCPRGLLLSNSC